MKIEANVFNKEELDLIQNKLNIAIDHNKDYSEDEIIQISDDAMDYFLSDGRELNDEPNAIGLICEKIVDKIYDTFGI